MTSESVCIESSDVTISVDESASRSWRRPFLKWAGGKYSMLPDLYQIIPAGMRLIEPFVGGGSVFLNSDKHACFLLADVNTDLINLYQMLAVVPDTVIRHARVMFDRLNDAESYMVLREEFNAQVMDGPERAAAFLFLNRHCFNGLIRYNRNNQFNVAGANTRRLISRKKKSGHLPEWRTTAYSWRRDFAGRWRGRVMLCTAIHPTNRCPARLVLLITPLVDLPGMIISRWRNVALPLISAAPGL